MTRIVIVGAGIAGHRAAVETRRLAPEAIITLLDADGSLPYDRPPLSKDFLLGKTEASDITLPDAARYQDLAIDFQPGKSVESIDRTARTVRTTDGASLSYDRLLLAMGSRVRTLPATLDHPRVRYLRTLADSARLRAELVPGCSVVVIGGGFIGLEVAAAARTHGCRVSVIEMEQRVLSRGLPDAVSGAIQALHEGRGVEILTGRTVQAITETAGRQLAVGTAAGTLLADVIIAGIGILPNVEIAANAGLEVSNGIVVDASCKTSDPAIFAAGEVTAHPGENGELRRLEAWKVSSEQAIVAAQSMLGHEAKFTMTPWFWSDQYDHNLQVIGTLAGAATYRLKGDMKSDQWTLVGFNRREMPVGAVAMNSGRDISMLRSALQKRGPVPPLLASALKDMAEPESAISATC